MSRFRVRKNPDPLLKFTQKTVLFQDISIFFVLKTELYLSSGTYFFFWKLVFHFTKLISLGLTLNYDCGIKLTAAIFLHII